MVDVNVYNCIFVLFNIPFLFPEQTGQFVPEVISAVTIDVTNPRSKPPHCLMS